MTDVVAVGDKDIINVATYLIGIVAGYLETSVVPATNAASISVPRQFGFGRQFGFHSENSPMDFDLRIAPTIGMT